RLPSIPTCAMEGSPCAPSRRCDPTTRTRTATRPTSRLGSRVLMLPLSSRAPPPCRMEGRRLVQPPTGEPERTAHGGRQTVVVGRDHERRTMLVVQVEHDLLHIVGG